jgi:hypothetical protein
MTRNSPSLRSSKLPPSSPGRRVSLGVALWFGGLVGCGAFGIPTDGGAGGSFGGFGGTGAGTTETIGGAGGAGGSTTKFTYGAYCGTGDCVPGMADGCVAPPEGGSGGASAGGNAPGGEGPAGGGGGSPNGGAGGRGGMGGLGGAGGAEEPSFGCIVVPDGDQPRAECDEVGSKADGEVCNESRECSPGFACVLTADMGAQGGAAPAPIGVCKPFCCGDLEEGCPDPTTFCALQPLFDSSAQTERAPLEVPVCTPVTPCTIFGEDCAEGETCTIVREDISGCIPTGDGNTCDPCPCAKGFVCNYNNGGVCLQLCDTNVNECPDQGICQGGTIDGVGICVNGIDTTCI